MANNIAILDKDGNPIVMKTTDTGSVHTPHHIVDSSALPTGASTAANQATANTALDAIQAAVEILDNIVSAGRAQVDVVSTALPSGAATQATLADILTELGQKIESGGTVVIDAASLSTLTTALESITIGTALPAGAAIIGRTILSDGADDVSISLDGFVRTESRQQTNATPSVTRTASSASNVANFVALNANRRQLIVHNNSTAVLYVKYGATASIAGGSESYTYKIAADTTWEMPLPIYHGRIDAIWSAANGFAMISEVAP